MRNRIGGWEWRLLSAALMLAAVPGLAQGDWNQAYGDIGNSSSVSIATDIGVRPLWSVQLNGPVAWSGPAIGRGETVYVGTTNGIFNAFWPDGKFRCAVFFPGGVFTSTPAVLPGGEVAVLFQRPAAPGMQGFLALLSEDCKPIWETELPRWTQTGNSVSSGSVKVWTLASTGASFLFVHARNTRQADVSTPNPDNATFNELLVYTTDGRLFARYPVGDVCLELHGGGWDNPFADIWDFLSSLWPSTGTLPPLYEQLGWPDSTPAVMGSVIRGFATPSEPLVAVTDGCKAELEVLQFRPGAATMPDRLVKTWSTSVDEKGTLLSSPAVTPDGQVAIGTSTRRLKVYDLTTRSLGWQVETKYPVEHPPAMAPGVWFTLSEHIGWLFDPNTHGLAPTARPQPYRIDDGALGAPAASLTQAFLPTFGGLEVWSHDLQILAHPLQHEHFHTTNPALSAAGRLYVVGQAAEPLESSVLYAFGPP